MGYEDKLKNFLVEVLQNAHVLSAVPTRSGEQVQVRIGYREGGKGKFCCYTMQTSRALEIQEDEAITFEGFCLGAFNLQKRIRGFGCPSWDAESEARDVVRSLIKSHESATRKLRWSVAQTAHKMSQKADNKRDEIEIAKCRKNIDAWILRGFRSGLSEDETLTIVREAFVKAVLNS